MRKSVLCIDNHGAVSLEMAISLRQSGIDLIGTHNLTEAEYFLKAENMHISMIVFIVESFEHFDAEAMRAFASTGRAKDLPQIVLCPSYDKNLINAVSTAGFIALPALPYDERVFLKEVSKILGFEPRGYISGLDNDVITFSFEEMLTREIKAAARGEYSFAVLMLVIVNKDENVYDPETQKQLASVFKNILKTYLRETDHVFLAGINGITAILPFADRRGAESVVERVRKLFTEHPELSGPAKDYTLNTCFVMYPDDARTKIKLMEKLKDFSLLYLKV